MARRPPRWRRRPGCWRRPPFEGHRNSCRCPGPGRGWEGWDPICQRFGDLGQLGLGFDGDLSRLGSHGSLIGKILKPFSSCFVAHEIPMPWSIFGAGKVRWNQSIQGNAVHGAGCEGARVWMDYDGLINGSGHLKKSTHESMLKGMTNTSNEQPNASWIFVNWPVAKAWIIIPPWNILKHFETHAFTI